MKFVIIYYLKIKGSINLLYFDCNTIEKIYKIIIILSNYNKSYLNYVT